CASFGEPAMAYDRISTSFDTVYQRSYASEAPDLRRLYENAKRDQWNASRDIEWTADVDLERGIFANELVDGYGTDALAKLDGKTFAKLNVEFSAWRLSQLLHGEEGAMLACSQLVDMVPGNDAKFFQATQVVDEARHTEVLNRYLQDKCGGRVYDITPNIKTLFGYILGNGKWFVKTVGLQLLAETFAVALFRMLAESALDPLLRSICKRILADESRHMGFSILSLPDEIGGLSPGDLSELEDFVREALKLVLSGQFPSEAYQAIGMNAAEIESVRKVRKQVAAGADQAYFRKIFKREMHQTVVTNMQKVGLLNQRTSAMLREMGLDPQMVQAA
ncbi:MAG TPA: ferritin-like domain-containing protein, partial [Candidatus Binataceae bacterium]|nr:ferritin-like domain-containing protein [Candidatus Binataceae bacterium]